MNPKIILIDWLVFVHSAIFAVRKSKMSLSWTVMVMIIACLKRIGLTPDDTVIVCSDYGKSWRKQLDQTYKSNRKAFRESFEDINWEKSFDEANWLLEEIDSKLDWYVLRNWTYEADDYFAVASRYYTDNEIIIITVDSDITQLWQCDNVKIFSPKTKRYKVKPKNFNVYKLISQKIKKEASDGLVNPILNVNDYEVREKCVSLLKLPDEIENTIKLQFKNLETVNKESNSEMFHFQKLLPSIRSLYNDHSKVETYEKSVKYYDKKEMRKKRKRKK